MPISQRLPQSVRGAQYAQAVASADRIAAASQCSRHVQRQNVTPATDGARLRTNYTAPAVSVTALLIVEMGGRTGVLFRTH